MAKLTEAILRKIIKEEMIKVLKEATQFLPETGTFTMGQVADKITQSTIGEYPYMENVRNSLKKLDPNVKVNVSSLKSKQNDRIIYNDGRFKGQIVLVDKTPVNLHLNDRLELFRNQ
jgi:hypothetical protein